MIIHPNFIFCRVPRTGGKFLQEFLEKHIDSCNRTRRAHFRVADLKEEERKDKFIFGTIRNPYDWYVSWWKYNSESSDKVQKDLFKEGRDKDFNKFIKYLFSRNSGKNQWFDLGIMYKLDIGLLSFKYLKILADYKYIFNAQKYKWEKRHNSLLFADQVLRFENFTYDLCDMFHTYNIVNLPDDVKVKLVTAKKTNSTEHDHYSKYYNKESIKLVRHKDRIIFGNYNYEYEI